ncbi:MFS transporter [Nocardioides pyridinolyticus]
MAMFAVGWGANQFASMLLAYRTELGWDAQTVALLLGLYAVGLIPTLLVGGAASDRWGRRAVVLPWVAVSPLATVLLIVWHDWEPGVGIARVLAGLSSGVVFGAASAWVADLSAGDPPGAGARRAALSLTAGFGLGPLAAGLVAEVSDHPLTVPYLPHLVIGVLALVLLLPVPGPRPAYPLRSSLLRLPAVTRGRRFVLTVAVTAPWLFAAPMMSFAYLPSVVDGPVQGGLAFTAVLTFVTLGSGVAVQPLARRLDDRRPLLAGTVGLACTIAACLLGVLAVTADSRWVILAAAPVFGAGYGCGLVSSLRESERLAPVSERGAVVGVFYGLAYLGMFAPYLLGAVAALGAGPRGALALAAVGAAAALVVQYRSSTHDRVSSDTGLNRPLRG